MFKKKALVLPGALLCAIALATQSIPASAAGNGVATIVQQQLARTQAQIAAQQGLAEYKQSKLQAYANLSPDNMAFDVSDMEELMQARVGQGFEVYTVKPQDVAGGRTDLSGMATPTGSWRFVVQVDDKPVGLVTVEMVDGRWQAVSFGAAGLAREYEAMRVAHGNADASNLRFIRIYQAQSDLMEVTSAADGKSRYAAMKSARESLLRFGLNKVQPDANAGMFDASQLMESLRAAVSKNMEVQH